jgi:hypothetical protein
MSLPIPNLDLPVDSKGRVLDVDNKPACFSNIIFLTPPNVKLPLKEDHIKEIVKCSNNVEYFIENYVKIFSLDDGWIYPKLRPYQKKLIEHYESNRFSNVMMGRQSGKSVTTLLYLLWIIIFKPDSVVGICANKEAMASENLQRLKEFYENVPVWLKVGIKEWNKTNIILENGSKVYSASTSPTTFRGLGIKYLFIDELAFIDCWSDFSKSVIPTITSSKSSQLMATSTPQGLNHFYNMWMDAEDGKTGYKNFKVEWWEIPGRDENWKQKIIGTLSGGLVEFNQEYACEFLGSSYTLVDIEALKRLKYANPILNEHYHKEIRIYQHPKPTNNYIIVGDGAKGGGDHFALHIIDVTSFPLKQVASANLTTPYLKVPMMLNTLGLAYNNAMIILENNEGAGTSVADLLYQVYEYENIFLEKDKKWFGFRTTAGNRNKILTHLKLFIENNKLIFRTERSRT